MARSRRVRMGELPATAICGNDITSSCLYVSALAILYAGPMAPVALLLVSAVLFLYRRIYAEVVGALPLNGGAYNALLNTTSKFRASIAACLTILSYIATAVISAHEAMEYVHSLAPSFPTFGATVGLLFLFACLTILGITESARVAIVIFLFHLSTLLLLLVLGVLHFLRHGGPLMENLNTPPPGGMAHALFFGFSAAMLGISGFESSANFVEEQAEGVFPKTLRNMWLAVTLINPTMALLALALVPMSAVTGRPEALLSDLGRTAVGPWLSLLVSVDAALVLSGAVLTSYVGVNGLVNRLTLDRCLPQFLLKRNRRGTTHRIILAFFLLCVSILAVTEGDLKALAGVYTISFLSVMVLFAIGNVLLKVKRARLPRPTKAGWPSVLLGLLAVASGIVGNAVANPPYLKVFLEYFLPTMAVFTIMLERIAILRAFLFLVRTLIVAVSRPLAHLAQGIRDKIEQINAQQVVFFTRGDNIANLNNAMLYIRRNEHTNRVKIVTVVEDPKEVPAKLKKDIEFLNEAYPEIEIEFVIEKGSFGPKLIQTLSRRWNIPTNLMFIGSPGGKLRWDLAELGGVRLII